MSLLQKVKRRFLMICVIACVLLFTVSWHLFWQSYESTVIKGSHKKTVIEQPWQSRLQLSANENHTESRINQISKLYNVTHNIVIQNGQTLRHDTIHTEVSKDVKDMLIQVTNLIQNSSQYFGKEEQKYIDILKQELNKIPIPSGIPTNHNASIKTKQPSMTNQWTNSKSNDIRVTQNENNDIIPNIPTAPDIPKTFIQNNLIPNSKINLVQTNLKPTEIEIKLEQNPKKTAADLSEKSKQQQVIDQASHNNINVHENLGSQRTQVKSNAHHFSDISATDLQNVWDKMKNNRNTISDRSDKRRNLMVPHIIKQRMDTFKEDYTDDLDGTDRPDYCSACFRYNFPVMINQPRLCKSTDSVRLLMFISSAPNNREIRVIIRKTWGAKCQDSDSGMKCLFVIGRASEDYINRNIETENRTYGDILQIDFKDSYGNLTYKTMSSFHWAAKYCNTAKYVMKTDDDMYINTELIPKMLTATPKVKFVGGYCWGSSLPNRDLTSKWYVSFNMFRKQRFPPMCSGTGYILSMDVVRKILVASHNVPFFHLEDVYVSMCLQKYGILPINILGFSNMYTEFDACRYRNSVLTSHQVPSTMLEDFWPTIEQCPPKFVAAKDLYIIVPYPFLE